MRIEHQPNLAALKRDWLGARIVGAVGLLLIGAVVALSVLNLLSQPAPQSTPPLPVALTPQALATARRQEDIALCNAAVAAAQGLGVLPAFAVRDGDETKPGNVQGRYICGAKTDAAHYVIAFDLACTRLDQGHCVVPVEVSQDGTSIYRRP